MSNDAPQSTRKELTSARIGHVVSDKRDKTRKVEIHFLQKLPKIGKYVRQRSVFHAHDERNESRKGDIVEIAPCRPLSKTKSWRLVRIIEQAPRGTKAEAGAAAGGEGQ